MSDRRDIFSMIAGITNAPAVAPTPAPGAAYLAKKAKVGEITSLDKLIAGGMLPPGLATQVVKVPE